MIARRIGAGVLAVALILGAWVVRDRVIEDDGAGAVGDDEDDDPVAGDVLYCISELRDTCRAIAADHPDLDVRIELAGTTLDSLSNSDAADAMWLTLDPLPSIAASRRSATPTLDPLDFAVTDVASSPLAVVVVPDSTATLVAACGAAVQLACLADQPQLSPTFAPIDTAVGMLGVATAAADFGGTALDINDVRFLTWGRRLAQAGATQLSGGTAIQTIQTRPTFDVAVGAAAELSTAQLDRFDVLATDPDVRLIAVLMVPEGVEPPDGLDTEAAEHLRQAGWGTAGDAQGAGRPPPEAVIVAVRSIWEDLS